ncbi:MAG TPA: hypothetical protein VJ777_22730, partial [Mycobacterium sp.]|nr:hypothetical protein [Mycobacterium sp.]
EPAIAVDPRNPSRIAAAADPYLNPARILVTTSDDGGQTWSAPLTVRPEGFAKSYDPVLQFAADGTLLVAGGASGSGQPHCQPGSAIFLARVSGTTISYRLARDARADGAFVDRAGFVLDRERNKSYVAWTESSGPGASCRGLPAASSAMVAIATDHAEFSPPERVPTSGFPAVFGTSLAIDRGGNLLVAMGEHEPGRRSRLTIATRQSSAFTSPEILAESADLPFRLTGLGGLFAPIPSITTSRTGSVAVAYAQPAPGGVAPLVFVRTAQAPWQAATPPAQPGTMELFPRLAFDRAGRLWLLSAGLAGGNVSFSLRARDREVWDEPVSVAAGPAGRYVELGQSLGLAISTDRLALGLPVDRATDSALLVATLDVTPPISSTTTTTQSRSPDVTPAKAAGGTKTAVVAVSVGAAVLVLMFGANRRKRRRRRRRSR